VLEPNEIVGADLGHFEDNSARPINRAPCERAGGPHGLSLVGRRSFSTNHHHHPPTTIDHDGAAARRTAGVRRRCDNQARVGRSRVVNRRHPPVNCVSECAS
jgi:hypothetical protein